MDLSPQLTADLQSLTVALDQPGVDLRETVQSLMVQMGHAVPSYLGATVTLSTGGLLASFTVWPESSPQPGSASLRIPLDLLIGAEPGSDIVFYASAAGAFVDLAADLAHAMRLPLTGLFLDDRLTLPTQPFSLLELSRVNRAVGVLIAGGRSVTEARSELHKRAEAEQCSLSIAAQRVLDTIPPAGADVSALPRGDWSDDVY
ncbi:MAG: hypothetical protein JWM76_2739 [Pseudonocardiales bacterium]|nr:hypothetical protein [Pseudonocardiales bacterium]